MKRTFVTITAAAILAIGGVSSAQAATNFGGTTTVVANNNQNGLEIEVTDIVPLNFSLNVGETWSGNVFTLYTDETAVNLDDLFGRTITATFNFTQPTVFGGDVGGTTFGQSLLGIIQQGVVYWNNNGNASFAYGNGGLLNVHLEDGIFNRGRFGLNEGESFGASINADFTLVSNAVPEPATWALLILGFGAVGATMRRRTEQSTTARGKLHFA